MSAVLACDGLVAGHAGVPVVRGLSMHVEAGEVVSLLGPNGAGKTTVLLTLAGALPALGGDVRVLDAPLRGGRPHVAARRGLALVPDDRAIFFGLSVLENLQLANRGRVKRGDIDDVLELFPALPPLLRRRAGLLSGGEQQMLALARALLARPQVLMVDEMSLGLAPVIVEGMLPVIRRIARERGTGVLLVEQHIDCALDVSDRAYVLNHGDLVLEGASTELAQDRSLLEASYMGTAATG